jgi:RNA polymerase sigma-70 factor (ECF subfamily)
MDQLNVLLKQMDSEKRELFLLRYQQQLSIKELAILLDVTEGTVKSRLFYIRRILLESLEERKTILKNGK